jgi:threonine synthase
MAHVFNLKSKVHHRSLMNLYDCATSVTSGANPSDTCQQALGANSTTIYTLHLGLNSTISFRALQYTFSAGNKLLLHAFLFHLHAFEM